MKTITVLLAVVTSAAAQDLIAYAFLYFNNAKGNQTFAGTCTAIQNQPSWETTGVEIKCKSRKLEPLPYLTGIHEIEGKVMKNCRSWASVRKPAAGIFQLPKVRTTNDKFCVIESVCKNVTLIPNQPNSITNRIISLYNRSSIIDEIENYGFFGV